jgi:hypothetical protein
LTQARRHRKPLRVRAAGSDDIADEAFSMCHRETIGEQMQDWRDEANLAKRP